MFLRLTGAVVAVIAAVSLIHVALVAAQDKTPDAASTATRTFQQVIQNPAPSSPKQPLPYSHKWHVGELSLDCAMCHENPDPGVKMSYPATETCMTCHESVATDKAAIQKLAEYAKRLQDIPWVPVYRVMPGVKFAHRKHLDAGVQCSDCHRNVQDLVQMQQVSAVTAMASCQTCHQQQKVANTCATCHSWPQDKLLQVVSPHKPEGAPLK